MAKQVVVSPGLGTAVVEAAQLADPFLEVTRADQLGCDGESLWFAGSRWCGKLVDFGAIVLPPAPWISGVVGDDFISCRYACLPDEAISIQQSVEQWVQKAAAVVAQGQLG